MLNSESEKRSNERLKSLRRRKKKYELLQSKPIEQKELKAWDGVQQERYKTLIENIPCAVYSAYPGKTGPTTFMSKKWKDWTGYSPEELYRDPEAWPKCIHPDDREKAFGAYYQACRNNAPYVLEYRIIHKDTGQVRYVRDQGQLSEDTKGATIRVDGIITNVTERKEVEKTLKDSEERFENLFNNALVGLYRTTPDGRILMANPALVRMLGYDSFEKLARRNLEDEGYHPEYPRSEFKERIDREGKVIGLESAWKRSNGTTLYVRESAQAIYDESGDILYYEGTVEDITQRKKAEEALRKAHDELEIRVQERTAELQQANEALRERAKIIDSTTDSVIKTDRNGIVTMWNRGAERSFGYTSEEMIGQPIHTLYSEQEQGRLAEIIETLLRGEEIATTEVTCVHKNGSPVELALSVLPFKDDSGNVTDLIGISKDISDLKKAQKALHESENRYRTVIENAREGIVVVQDGMLRFVNSRHTLVTGRSQEESMSRPFVEFVHPDDRRMVERIHTARLRGEQVPPVYEFRIIDKNGQTRWLENNGVLIEWNDRPASLNFLRNITESKKAEEALREREEMIRALVETSRDWIWSIDLNGVHTYCNPAVEQILGYSPDELVGERSFDLIHDDDRVKVEANMPTWISEKRGWSNLMLRWRHKDGTYRYLESNAVPVMSPDNELVGFRGVDRDITDRKRAEEVLRKTTRLLETIFAHTHILVAYLDSNFNFVRVNRAYARADGREPDFFIGRNHFELYPDAENEVIFRKVVETGVPYLTETKPFDYTEHPERGTTYWDWSLVPIKEQDGVVSGLVLTLADVTVRKKAEQALLKREATLKSIFRAAPVGIGLEHDRVLARVNDTICHMLGYSSDELIGRHAKMFYPSEEDYRRVRQEKRRQILEKGSATVETRWKRKDGQVIDILLSTTVLDRADFSNGVTFAALDITERKKAEQALRESEEKFRSLAEQSPNMIFINKRGRIVYVNNKCEEVMGYKREELCSEDFDFRNLVAPESIGLISEKFMMHAKGQDVPPYDYSIIKKDGRRIEAINASKLIQYDGETAILGIVTDITEHKKAEQALRESEDRLKILFESAPDAIYLIDSEGRFVDGNRAAVELIGYAKEEVVGKSLAETGLLSDEQLLRAQESLNKVATGNLSGPNEYIVKRKNGIRVSVEVRTFPVNIGGKILTLGIARDITKHKQTEKKLLEHQAKLKSLASQLSLIEERERHRLATDLHDQISQSLVISKIKLDQLRKSSASDELNESLKEISNCLGQTIDDTRALTFDLSYPILYELGFEAAVAEWLTDQIQDKHEIDTEFKDDGQQKPLDDDIRVLLFRNVRELLINVIKHAQASKVRVSVRRENEYINVKVEDDGIGFDPDEVTLMAAKRAEFGLFSVRERLEQLGGLFEIDSEPGYGCRITMRAPLKYNNSNDRIRR